MNTSLEFMKLEKVVFGGLRGNSLNIRLKEINDLYVEKYKVSFPKWIFLLLLLYCCVISVLYAK